MRNVTYVGDIQIIASRDNIGYRFAAYDQSSHRAYFSTENKVLEKTGFKSKEEAIEFATSNL